MSINKKFDEQHFKTNQKLILKGIMKNHLKKLTEELCDQLHLFATIFLP